MIAIIPTFMPNATQPAGVVAMEIVGIRVPRNSRSSGKRLALTVPTRVSAFAARLRTSPCRHHLWTESSTYGWSTPPRCSAFARATARSSLRQDWPGAATAFGRSIMTGFCTSHHKLRTVVACCRLSVSGTDRNPSRTGGFSLDRPLQNPCLPMPGTDQQCPRYPENVAPVVFLRPPDPPCRVAADGDQAGRADGGARAPQSGRHHASSGDP